jgi:hypothetical protein
VFGASGYIADSVITGARWPEVVRIAAITMEGGSQNHMQPSRKAGLEEDFLAEVEFTIVASLHRDCHSENFLHEISGRLTVQDINGDIRQEAGEISAWLVQFSEAEAQGIRPRLLGDGYSQEISSYWQELFDLDTDEFRSEIKKRWKTKGSDLLIIDSVWVSPDFRGAGMGWAAVGRTIDFFRRTCDLVACIPRLVNANTVPLSDSSTNADILSSASVEEQNVVARLQDRCLKAGFRPYGTDGIYLLNPTHWRSNMLLP